MDGAPTDPTTTKAVEDVTTTALDSKDPKARLRLIDHYLDRSLDLPIEERSAFLARECPTDIHPDVERLVAALSDDGEETLEGGVFGGSLARQMAFEIQRDMPLDPGDVVGAYRIVRELGRGGMAVVYLAERMDGAFHHQVALKVVLEPQRNPRLTARFHLERQILAGLLHPNIAQLLDGGLTEQGQPYFAMEWVDGVAIDRFCDQARLSVDGRLKLFAQVLRAVATAHRSLVIHRDLKPSNILVKMDPDGEPQVKLLDFGIAKVLDPDLLDKDMQLTRTAGMPMTPEYASPEQLLGEPLTTASDIYQLGILLFQLLCGCRPFENLSFAERIARDHEPSRPSTLLASDAAHQVAERRSTTRRALRREINGDLETLVLTCLRRQPERRYASVMDVVYDIEAYLEERPIRARADSVIYRAQKFVGRNRWATVTVAGLLLALGVVLILTAGRLRQERDLAQVARAEAEASNEESEQVVEFLLGLFKGSQKGAVRAESITALDLLDRGTQKIETELKDRPKIRARLLTTLSQVHRDLAIFDRAKSMSREALQLTEALYGPDSLEVASRLDQLGGILNRTGDFKEAEQIHRRALAIQGAQLDEDHPDIAASLNSLAAINWRLGRYPEVEPLLKRSLEIRREKLGPAHEQTAAVHKNLCVLLRTLGRLQEAESHCTSALESYTAALGPADPKVAGVLNTLALLRRAQGEWDEAEALFMKAWDTWRESLGEQHVDTTMAMQNLAGVYTQTDRLQEAEALHRQALAIHEKTYGSSHTRLTGPLQNLGFGLFLQGRFEEAAPCFERVISLYDTHGQPEHSEIARPLVALASIWLEEKRFDEAEALVQRANGLRLKTLGPDHPELADGLRVMANIYRETGRYEDSEALFLQALALRGDGKDPRQLQLIVEGYADLLQRLNRSQEVPALQLKYPDRYRSQNARGG